MEKEDVEEDDDHVFLEEVRPQCQLSSQEVFKHEGADQILVPLFKI